MNFVATLNNKKTIVKIISQNVFYNLNYSYSKSQFEYFRIGIACYSLLSFISYLLDYEIFLSPNGLVSWEVTNASAFWFEPHLLKFSTLINIEPQIALVLFATINILTLLLLLCGVFTRATAILSLIFFIVFSVIVYPYQYGVDLYQTVFLLFLCVFPSGYSKRAFKSNKIFYAKLENQQKIGIRTIQLYLCLTYFSAGLGKAKMDSWYNGEFIFLSLSDPNYQLLPFPLDIHHSIFALFGISVICLELLYFVFVGVPYLRTIGVLLIVSMHLFIAFFMGLLPFGLLLSMVNVIIWYPVIVADINKIRHKS